ncbi:MAG: SPOR domain-containing protein [Cocleimonas sp.]
MKNKTYQTKPISFGNSQFLSNDGKKRLSKQTGAINQLLMIFIIGGLGYGAFIAKNKGLISLDKTQTFVSNLSDKVSGKSTSGSSDFSGYGVQLVATKQLEQAKGIMNDFARDGYSAFVVASASDNSRLYKVRLGPYTHKPEAIAVQDKVVRRYPNNPYVKSSLVIYKPN